jgi:hypoxanthine-guanine phosphoribosyltransferase
MEVSATPIDYLNETMQLDASLAPLTDMEAQIEFVNAVMYAKIEDRDAREEAEYEYHHKRGHNVLDIEDIISSDLYVASTPVSATLLTSPQIDE